MLDKRDHLTWFYIWMVLGLVSSVVSIVFGGRGIAAIASGGFDGTWSLKPNGDSFNKQAIACLLGMALLLASLFAGRTKPENANANQIQRLNATITMQQAQIDDLRARCAVLADQLKSLSSNHTQKAKPAVKKQHR